MTYKVIDYDFNNSICMNKIEFTRFVRVNKLIEFVRKSYFDEELTYHMNKHITYDKPFRYIRPEKLFTIYNGVLITCKNEDDETFTMEPFEEDN